MKTISRPMKMMAAFLILTATGSNSLSQSSDANAEAKVTQLSHLLVEKKAPVLKCSGGYEIPDFQISITPDGVSCVYKSGYHRSGGKQSILDYGTTLLLSADDIRGSRFSLSGGDGGTSLVYAASLSDGKQNNVSQLNLDEIKKGVLNAYSVIAGLRAHVRDEKVSEVVKALQASNGTSMSGCDGDIAFNSVAAWCETRGGTPHWDGNGGLAYPKTGDKVLFGTTGSELELLSIDGAYSLIYKPLISANDKTLADFQRDDAIVEDDIIREALRRVGAQQQDKKVQEQIRASPWYTPPTGSN